MPIFFLFLLIVTPSIAWAADSKSSSPSVTSTLSGWFPHPMVSVSYGNEARWELLSPGTGLNLNKGWDLHGSFDFSVLGPLHLVLGYFHNSMTGTADFDYTEYNTQARVRVSHVSVKTSLSGPFLGLRFIPFESSPVHFYFEGGGIAGFYQVTYYETPSEIQNMGIKLADFEPFSGAYGEGGLEIRAFNALMIGGGVRYAKMRTGKMVTLNSQELDLEGTSVFATLGVRY